MKQYRFEQGSFYTQDTGRLVGHGWNFTHYFPSDWTGDGNTDLLVRKETGQMVLYPYDAEKRSFYGKYYTVAEGWDFTHYLPADWDADGLPEMLVRTDTGDMFMYELHDMSFLSSTPVKVAENWDADQILVGGWPSTI